MGTKETETYDGDYYKELERGWLFYPSARICYDFILKHIIGPKVLELGCGTGVGLGYIKNFFPDYEYLGLEINTLPEEYWKKRNLNVKLFQELDDGEKFNTVYSSHTMEHTPKPEEFLDFSIRHALDRVIHIVPDGNANKEEHAHIFNRMNLREMADGRGYDYNLEYIHCPHIPAIGLVIQIR